MKVKTLDLLMGFRFSQITKNYSNERGSNTEDGTCVDDSLERDF